MNETLFFDEEFLYQAFYLVFIDKEDNNHKLDPNFMYKDKNFEYIKENYHAYTLEELREILYLYDLSMNYEFYGGPTNCYERHRSRIFDVVKYIENYLSKEDTTQNNHQEFSYSLFKNNSLSTPINNSVPAAEIVNVQSKFYSKPLKSSGLKLGSSFGKTFGESKFPKMSIMKKNQNVDSNDCYVNI